MPSYLLIIWGFHKFQRPKLHTIWLNIGTIKSFRSEVLLSICNLDILSNAIPMARVLEKQCRDIEILAIACWPMVSWKLFAISVWFWQDWYLMHKPNQFGLVSWTQAERWVSQEWTIWTGHEISNELFSCIRWARMVVVRWFLCTAKGNAATAILRWWQENGVRCTCTH